MFAAIVGFSSNEMWYTHTKMMINEDDTFDWSMWKMWKQNSFVSFHFISFRLIWFGCYLSYIQSICCLSTLIWFELITISHSRWSKTKSMFIEHLNTFISFRLNFLSIRQFGRWCPCLLVVDSSEANIEMRIQFKEFSRCCCCLSQQWLHSRGISDYITLLHAHIHRSEHDSIWVYVFR